jgi:hypothetical protein
MTTPATVTRLPDDATLDEGGERDDRYDEPHRRPSSGSAGIRMPARGGRRRTTKPCDFSQESGERQETLAVTVSC